MRPEQPEEQVTVSQNGPVACLLASLSRLGATIDTNWVVNKGGMPSLRLLTAPKQEFQAWLAQAQTATHLKNAARKRSALEGLEGYDHRATAAGRPPINSRQYPYWLMFKTGVCWTEREQEMAGITHDGRCKACGEEGAGIAHLITECPHEEDLRAASPLAEAIREGRLTKSIISHGIMPRLASGVGTIFWGNKERKDVLPYPQAASIH